MLDDKTNWIMSGVDSGGGLDYEFRLVFGDDKIELSGFFSAEQLREFANRIEKFAAIVNNKDTQNDPR